ncbi:MAG TPA: hypothetical protein VNA15_07475 [Candidatus Angelobacter sp.]|nr:hypothetical protein [Candidatus Angelobacter sp.]
MTVYPSGRIDLVVKGTDNGIWHKYMPFGESWSAWDSPGGATVSTPAVTQSGRETLIAVTGTDNAIWFDHYGSVWQGWMSLGGIRILGAPSIISL